MPKTTEKKGFLGLSRTIIVLGLVSLFTDLSSEMLVPLLPIFLKDVLNAAPTAIGLIEGIAEGTASLLRVFAGWLADRLGKPKLLATAGYGLSSLSKPFLILVTAWPQVLGIRFADRFGKGIRSAPRDVIIAESVEPERRGRAFGFHRAMDTTGAVLGPLAALLVLRTVSGLRPGFNGVFVAAAVPAFIAVIILAVFVPERAKPAHPVAPPKIRWSLMSPKLKVFLLVVAVFAIGNSSDAFLVLRANSLILGQGRDLKASMELVLIIYALFNAVSALISTPAGILSDRVGRRPVILSGLLVFVLVYLGFGLARSAWAIWPLFAVYGIHVGLIGGVLRAYAADLAPRELRGTVIGGYYTVEGSMLFLSSLIAGLIWRFISLPAVFYYGAAMAALSALLLLFIVPRESTASEAGVADSK